MNTTMELKCVYKHRIRCGANLVCFHFSTDFEVVNFKRSFFEDSVEFAFILNENKFTINNLEHDSYLTQESHNFIHSY